MLHQLERVIDNDKAVYRNSFNHTAESKDPTWREILPLYKSMNKAQQESLLNFIRMIQVNTVSHLLGILDGSTYLNENRESFVLTTEQDDELINGSLQDIFLELEEI